MAKKNRTQGLLVTLLLSVALELAWRLLASSKEVAAAADRQDAKGGWAEHEGRAQALKTLRQPEGVAICKALIRDRLEYGELASLSQEKLREASGINNVATVELICRRLGVDQGLGLVEDRRMGTHTTHEFVATDLLMDLYEHRVYPELEQALVSPKAVLERLK